MHGATDDLLDGSPRDVFPAGAYEMCDAGHDQILTPVN